LLKFTYLRPISEICITQRYVIIAYLVADREQRILNSIKAAALSTQNLLRTWLTARITTRQISSLGSTGPGPIICSSFSGICTACILSMWWLNYWEKESPDKEAGEPGIS